MQQIKEYQILYGIEKGGKTKIWAARIEYDVVANKAVAIMEYGQLAGKKQTSIREYTTGKVKRTALEQCIQETDRKWTDKKEKEGYVLSYTHPEQLLQQPHTLQLTPESPKGKISKKASSAKIPGPSSRKSTPTKLETTLPSTILTLPILPMLAKIFDPSTSKKKRNDIVFPCFVQPKLDGLRCIIYVHDGEIVAQSRTGNHFKSMERITTALRPFFQAHPEIVLDGELYTPNIPFEVLAGIIKRQTISDRDYAKLEMIEYHVYDIVDLQAPFNERITFLRNNFKDAQYPRIKFVETYLVNTVAEFRTQFSEFVANGYEGIMLRNITGLYRTNYRSDDLQKYKEFMEDEFRIIGFTEGDGRDAGTVKWKCQTSEGKEFSVRPRGTIESRRKLFRDGELYIGKLLTVIFQELTDDGKPRFPVGKDIREGY